MKTQHGTTREKRRGEKRRGGGNRATEPINHHACSVRSYNYGWASKRRGRRGKEKRGEKRGGRKEKKREERFHFSPPQAPLGFEKTLGPSTKPLSHLESRWRSEDFSNTALAVQE